MTNILAVKAMFGLVQNLFTPAAVAVCICQSSPLMASGEEEEAASPALCSKSPSLGSPTQASYLKQGCTVHCSIGMTLMYKGSSASGCSMTGPNKISIA